MSTTTAALRLDRYQGRDAEGRPFGYIGGVDPDDGGYFFTWLETLDATVGSLQDDEEANATFSESEAAAFLRAKIGARFDSLRDTVLELDRASHAG